MEAELLKWLKGSPDCRLPCFGGIRPGLSTWEEAKQILAPMGEIVGLDENVGCTSGLCNSLGWSPGGFYEQNSMEFHGGFYSGVDDRIISMFLEGDPPSPVLRLDSILSTYGPPAKVFIEAGPSIGDSPFGNFTYFNIMMAYPNYHFIIFFLWKGLFNNEYKGCIQQGPIDLFIDLRLQEWTDDNIRNEVHHNGEVPEERFIPLEKATGFTIEKFYDTFKTVSGNECLTVPVQPPP
jgi:hypothetical protein